MIRIDKKITGCSVVSDEKPEARPAVVVHEGLERPERLLGATYRIKTPLSDHALYVTVNDVILGEGPDAIRRPFEVFINSKAMDHFQWIVALTRVISAVFRKGGDVTFLVEELRSVFDPKGGYFKKGGRFMPSLVAEIGEVLETHLRGLGLIAEPETDPHVAAYLAEKRAALSASPDPAPSPHHPARAYGIELTEVAGAALCPQCGVKAVKVLDGCATCLNCGASKCG